MYAIAYKHTPRGSWQMLSKVYDDREKCDAAISGLKQSYYRVQRVFFDADV